MYLQNKAKTPPSKMAVLERGLTLYTTSAASRLVAYHAYIQKIYRIYRSKKRHGVSLPFVAYIGATDT